MKPYRVLVTGSRDWPFPAAVRNRLDEAYAVARAAGRPLVVVHGAARGADTHADDWAGAYDPDPSVTAERHPVTEEDWRAPCSDRCAPGHRGRRRDGTDFCPAVGMRRNERMVAAGADLCLAFIHKRSSGATGCADLAEAAGIPVRRYEWPRT